MNQINKDLSLFCTVSKVGNGSKQMKLAKKLGAFENIVFYGKGILENDLLQIFGITEERKEILISIIPLSEEEVFFNTFDEVFEIDNLHHGILFSLPIKYVYLHEKELEVFPTKEAKEANMKYEAIFVVVNRNTIDDVIEAAKNAGSTGGTIFHGRGTGKEDKVRLFNLDFEPEKDILLTLSPVDKTEAIVDAIKTALSIEEHGKGILFVLDVNRAMGLYNGDES